MREWLGSAFGAVCVVAVVLKLTGGAWCLVELYRKWRTTPELWSLDWLDIVFRVERAFGVTLAASDFAGWSAEARAKLTAGQVWETIADKLRASGTGVPVDGWERVVAALSEVFTVRAERVAIESRLCADLGMARVLD